MTFFAAICRSIAVLISVLVLATSPASAQNYPILNGVYLVGTSFGMRHYVERGADCQPVDMRTDAFYDGSESPHIWKSYDFFALSAYCGRKQGSDLVVNIRYYVLGQHVSDFTIVNGRNSDGTVKIEVSNFIRHARPSQELNMFRAWFDSGTNGAFHNGTLARGQESQLSGDALRDYQFAQAVDHSFYGSDVADAPNGFDVVRGSWVVVDEPLLAKLADVDMPDALKLTYRNLYRDIKNFDESGDNGQFFLQVKRLVDAGIVEGVLLAANFTADNKRKFVQRAKPKRELTSADFLMGMIALGVALNAVLPDQPEWSDEDRMRQRNYEEEQRRRQVGINTDLAIGWLN